MPFFITCRFCKKEKSSEEYYKAATKNGKDSVCKECRCCQVTSRKNAIRDQNKEKNFDLHSTQTCIDCKKEKPLSTFNKDLSLDSGFRNQCKKCRDTYRARLLLEKRVAVLGPVPKECEICGAVFEETNKAYWDHKHFEQTTALEKNDRETENGRGWLCMACNSGLGQLGDNPEILEKAKNYLLTKGFCATRKLY